MSNNYYQTLQVNPDASLEEIQRAYDARNRVLRNLASHNDPQKRADAEKERKVLEMAFNTLKDPNKRQVYDSSVGIGGNIGGLVDPGASGRLPSLAPLPYGGVPQNPIPSSPSPQLERTDAWVCLGCGTANEIKTRFCRKCAKVIGIACPSCNAIIKVDSVHCSACGVDIKNTFKKRNEEKRIAEEEEKARQAEAIRIQKYQQELNARLGPIHEHGQHLTKWKSGATIFLSLLFYPVGILLFLHSFYHAFQIRSIAQTAGDSEYRSLANIIFTIGLILIGILVFALCIGFISAMSSGY